MDEQLDLDTTVVEEPRIHYNGDQFPTETLANRDRNKDESHAYLTVSFTSRQIMLHSMRFMCSPEPIYEIHYLGVHLNPEGIIPNRIY